MTQPVDETTGDIGSSRSLHRLTLFALLFVLLTTAGLFTVYDRLAERSITFDPQLLAPHFLICVLLLLLLYFTADGLRLYFTLKALGHEIRGKSIAKLVFINFFFSNITPMATGGGFAQIWYLQHQGVPVGRASAATTIRTILAVIFIFSLTPIFLVTLPVLKNTPVIGQIGPILAVLIVLYLGFFAIVLFRTHWLIIPLSRILEILHRIRLLSDHLHQRLQYKARREMLRFSHSFGEYIYGPKLFVCLSVLFTFIFLLCLFSFPALLINALGYDTDYLTSVGILVVTTFIMYFSPTPGASGIAEGLFGTFFQTILTGGHLLLVIVAWRFLTIYVGMIAGLIVLQRELLKHRKG